MDLVADVEMPDEAQQEDDPLAIEAQQEDDPLAIEAQQEDDPLSIGEDIAQLEHGYAQSGVAVSGDVMSAQIGSGTSIPQEQAPPTAEKGIQTQMPGRGRNKATQTQKRGRDRAVQTKEQGIDRDRAQRRAEEQKIAALQKEVRGLKVRYSCAEE